MTAPKSSTSGILKFRGSQHFRWRIIYATLSGRSVKISDIRALDENPGLQEFEANFLRLIETLSNGSKIEINETGTTLKYKPGTIIGGRRLEHECHADRGIGYFLEALACLAPFSKKPISITLSGVTCNRLDSSVDVFRTVTIPLLKKFGIEDTSLKIIKRGVAPLGGGRVQFECTPVRSLTTCDMCDSGRIKRVRGLACTVRVSPATASRLAHAARGPLNSLLPDVWVFTDHTPGGKTESSPGYGLSLVAESTTGCMISAESSADGNMTPEEMGEQTAHVLLEEIASGGCVDHSHQSLALLLMVLCPEDVSRIRLGKLSDHTIGSLQLIREFFSVKFRIRPDPESQSVLLACQGIGFRNMARQLA